MTLRAIACIMPILFLASASAAQEGSPASMSPAVAARFGVLPEKLAGLDRADGGYSAPLAAYRGRANLDPIIAVAVADAPRSSTVRALAGLGRAGPEQDGMVETMFEGVFSVPGYPGAITFFGDYLTKKGVKQVWIADYHDVRTTASVTIYRVEDRRTTFDAIRKDLFGGAVMTRAATKAELN